MDDQVNDGEEARRRRQGTEVRRGTGRPRRRRLTESDGDDQLHALNTAPADHASGRRPGTDVEAR